MCLVRAAPRTVAVGRAGAMVIAPAAVPWRQIAAVSGVALIGCGIALMQAPDSDALSILLSLPPLNAVFPNPAMVLLGTLCAALGAALVHWWLAPHAGMAAAGIVPPGTPPVAGHSVLDPRHRAPLLPTPIGPPAGTMPPATEVGAGVPLSPTPMLDTDLPGTPSAAPTGYGALSGRMVRRLAVGIVACALYGCALVCAAVHAEGTLGIGCLLVALPLCYFALAGSRGGRWVPPTSPIPIDCYDIGIVLALIIGYIALNGHDLRDWRYAFIGDEWAFYEVASGIARGHTVDLFNQAGVYGIHPLAGSAYQALVMRLLGVNVTGWRMSSILSAALPLCALYPLAKAMGGRLYAVAASAIYASSALLWAFSHIGYNANDPLLAMIPSAALAYFGLRDGRSGYLFAAGALAGAGWYTLFTGRLMIVVVTLVVLSEWRRGRRVVAAALLPIAAGFMLVVLPLLVDNGGETFRAMFPLVSFSGVRATQAAPDLLAGNAVRAAYEFFHATGYAIQHLHYFSGSLFDPVSATGLAVGFVLALRLRRALWARLTLIWFAVTVALTTPLYYVPQVADTRVQVAIPPAALLAALGLCSAARGLATLVPGREPRTWLPAYSWPRVPPEAGALVPATRRAWSIPALGRGGVPRTPAATTRCVPAHGPAPASQLPVARTRVTSGPEATAPFAARVQRVFVATALASVLWLNGYRFYATTPRLVVQGPTSLALGAILTHPRSLVVLTGGLANAAICAPLDGYGIDPARVLRIAAGRLAPVCPSAGLFVVPRAPDVLVLLEAQSTGGSCGSEPRPLVVAPNGRQALWGHRIPAAEAAAVLCSHSLDAEPR